MTRRDLLAALACYAMVGGLALLILRARGWL
jgi:hypothetical protein